MKVAVIGTGYVAGAYLKVLHFLGYHPLVLSRNWLDYYDPQALRFCLEVYQPDVVINAAGYTGRTVDDCQSNREECYMANVALVRTIGEVCRQVGARLIHVSTGCMFTGFGVFREESSPNNLTQWYAQCKLHAEAELAAIDGRHWIFRIRMPFSDQWHSRNWLVKLCGHPRILDGLNSVTFLPAFAMRSWQLMEKAPPGIYHAAESSPVRTIEVAKLLLDSGLRTLPLSQWTMEDFLEAHTPRSTAVLDVHKFETAHGSKCGNPHAAIRWCIAQLLVAKKARPGAI